MHGHLVPFRVYIKEMANRDKWQKRETEIERESERGLRIRSIHICICVCVSLSLSIYIYIYIYIYHRTHFNMFKGLYSQLLHNMCIFSSFNSGIFLINTNRILANEMSMFAFIFPIWIPHKIIYRIIYSLVFLVQNPIINRSPVIYMTYKHIFFWYLNILMIFL